MLAPRSRDGPIGRTPGCSAAATTLPAIGTTTTETIRRMAPRSVRGDADCFAITNYSALRIVRERPPSRNLDACQRGLLRPSVAPIMTVTRRRFLRRVAAIGGTSLAFETMTGLGLLAQPSQ